MGLVRCGWWAVMSADGAWWAVGIAHEAAAADEGGRHLWGERRVKMGGW